MRMLCALVAALVVSLGAEATRAGEAGSKGLPERTITVTVTGQASAKPNAMHIRLVSQATAGTASDALKQCKKKADSAVQAIKALSIKDSAVERKMYEFSHPSSGNPYVMRQPAVQTAGTKVSQAIEFKLRGIQGKKQEELAATIAKVLDAANKAGVGLAEVSAFQARVTGGGEAVGVRYALEDATPLREKALKDALNRSKVALANLEKSGVKIGKLKSIAYNSQSVLGAAGLYLALGLGEKRKEEKAAYSSSPQEVTASVPLSLAYEIKD